MLNSFVCESVVCSLFTCRAAYGENKEEDLLLLMVSLPVLNLCDLFDVQEAPSSYFLYLKASCLEIAKFEGTTMRGEHPLCRRVEICAKEAKSAKRSNPVWGTSLSKIAHEEMLAMIC